MVEDVVLERHNNGTGTSISSSAMPGIKDDEPIIEKTRELRDSSSSYNMLNNDNVQQQDEQTRVVVIPWYLDAKQRKRWWSYVLITIGIFILLFLAGLFLTVHPRAIWISSKERLYSCSQECPDVDYTLVVRMRKVDFPGTNATFWARGYCPEQGECGLYGPTIRTRPGQKLTILVKNQINPIESAKAGPRVPVGPDDWIPLMNNVTGRYAGLQGCYFTFTGRDTDPKVMNHMNMPHDFDGTNLHLHGLTVEPHLYFPFATSDPESEMIDIRPNQCFCYKFNVHGDQSPGSFWYHSHRHGSTAVQTWSGMAGLIRVEGGLDEELPKYNITREEDFVIWDPHVAEVKVKELLLKSSDDDPSSPETAAGAPAFGEENREPLSTWDVLQAQQDAQVNKGGFQEKERHTKEEAEAQEMHSRGGIQNKSSSVLPVLVPDRMLVTSKQPVFGVDFFLTAQTDQSKLWYLVNGANKPNFELQLYEIFSLRVLCATAENVAGLRFVHKESGEEAPFHVTASDGISRDVPKKESRLVMGGGYREDILIRFEKPGLYEAISDGLSSLQFFCTGPDDVVLATFTVATTMYPIPQTHPVDSMRFVSGIRKPIHQSDIVRKRTLSFALATDRHIAPFPQFLVNDKMYAEKEIMWEVKGGEAEEWVILNSDVTMHPFHSHMVPFMVKSVTNGYRVGDPQMKTIVNVDPDRYRDTLIIPPWGIAKIWIRWPDEEKYRGKTVVHCHFLAHEDTGMIANIQIS